MEDIEEQAKLNQIIDKLFDDGCCKFIELKFEDEDIKIKFEILKIICGVKEENEFFKIDNIINIVPRNCFIQQRTLAFLNNMKSYRVEQLITRFDSISSYYYALQKETKFINYLKETKFRAIPFFKMLGFISYINLGKDKSEEIISLMNRNYIVRQSISKYIEENRKSLFNIILYYYQVVLSAYDERINGNYDQGHNNLLYEELKNSLQRYLCFNQLYDEGEITYFVNCLYKTITSDIKSIYLKNGPEIAIINNIIKYIIEEILESFSVKDYYEKPNLNKLYDLIAEIISSLSEESMLDNYAKFIIKYCSEYKKGSKNIVFLFFSGLNPDNFENTFNDIKFNGNSKDYYNNIELYTSQITKNIMKNKKDSVLPNKDSKKYHEKNADNIEMNQLNSDNCQVINNNSKIKAHTIINKENNNEKNIDNMNNKENKLKKNVESSCANSTQPKTENNKNNEDLYKQIEELKKQLEMQQKTINEMRMENKKTKEELVKFKVENKKTKEELVKFKEKAMCGHIEMKTEIYKLKNQMKQISYRDISKPIINNYIKRYENNMKNLENLCTGKDKAEYIKNYLIGPELNYYNKIITKYYDSNHKSHISTIFKDFGKNYIIGLTGDKKDIIDKIFSDYCKIILEEKIDNDNNSLIEKWFGIKKIIEDLAKEKML